MAATETFGNSGNRSAKRVTTLHLLQYLRPLSIMVVVVLFFCLFCFVFVFLFLFFFWGVGGMWVSIPEATQHNGWLRVGIFASNRRLAGSQEVKDHAAQHIILVQVGKVRFFVLAGLHDGFISQTTWVVLFLLGMLKSKRNTKSQNM